MCAPCYVGGSIPRTVHHEVLLSILHAQANVWRELLHFNGSRWDCLLEAQLSSFDASMFVSADSWHRAGLYWIVHVASHLRYGGEAILLARRATNHVSRILDTSGTTQQPFFRFIPRGHTSRAQITPRLAGWIILPVSRAPILTVLRAATLKPR